jgi:DNA mismatch repair protein MutS2
MNAHSLQVLEFAEALDVVARGAASPLGAEAVRALAPSVEAARVDAELRRVEEMTRLLVREGGWPAPSIPDLRQPLDRLRVAGSVWDAAWLRDAAVLLASSRTSRAALMPRGAEFPLLGALAERLASLPKLEESITRAVDDDGTVRDDASPELKRLRRESRGVRNRIVERLAGFMASLPPQYQVSDASVTVREGRYVIPVRREGRGEVGGIVHDESGTGATLFVEPPIAIEMMNRLRELEAAEQREVIRILRELTDGLRPHADELRVSLGALVELDTVLARARYAVQVEGVRPTLLESGDTGYTVVQGRHPVLLARAETVVPFDLRMDEGERTLLISGPNTGGKTVLLKAIGLISLLAQSGVIPPVGPGTRLPLFDEVFADIGDEQSIEASLSTFSAHLRNLQDALGRAAHGSLVLIDEIGSGTDPQEGGALARAVLLELTRRSAFTVATTHLGQLKLLATEEPAVVNGSLQFDAERLEPTYRLVKGVPGRSYGLAIARRLGLPGALIDEAEQTLPSGERDIARLLLELEAKEQRLAAAGADLDAALERTRRLEAELETREADLRRREKDAERRARQQARDLLLSSRQEVESAIELVRSAASADAAALDEAARTARRAVEEAARRQRERTPEPKTEHGARAERPAAAALEVGARVRIESLGRTGTVVELRDGKAMVEAGSLRMLLARTDLTPLPPGDQQPEQRPRSRPAGGSGYAAAADASMEVDLRGMRVDEIEMRLARALDSAIMAGLPSFRIIHGKGLGVLRDRVSALLRDDPRIVNARPGERFEGGTGVTVVEFA